MILPCTELPWSGRFTRINGQSSEPIREGPLLTADLARIGRETGQKVIGPTLSDGGCSGRSYKSGKICGFSSESVNFGGLFPIHSWGRYTWRKVRRADLPSRDLAADENLLSRSPAASAKAELGAGTSLHLSRAAVLTGAFRGWLACQRSSEEFPAATASYSSICSSSAYLTIACTSHESSSLSCPNTSGAGDPNGCQPAAISSFAFEETWPAWPSAISWYSTIFLMSLP